MKLFNFKDADGDLSLIRIAAHVIAAVALLIVTTALWPLHTVPTGSRGVITVGGAIRGIENEGFVWVWPWQRLDRFSVRAEAAQVEGAEGATSDTQPVKVTLTVRYAIKPDQVAEVFEKYSHDGNLYSYVDTATREAFKAVTARFTATDLVSKRQEVSSAVNTAIQAKLGVFGAQVISVDVTSFLFSDSYMAAINDKVTQEQKRMAAENRARTAEAEQKIKVVTAEAEANAARAKADGEAYANLKVAQAQAEALRVQNAALAQNKDVLELRRIEVEAAKAAKWDGKLPQNIYAGAPMPFLQVGK